MGCFSSSRSLAFVSAPSLASRKGHPSTALTLGDHLPLNSLGVPAIWAGHRGPNSEEGEISGEMPPTGDERHHPSAIRNRGFIAAELVKWVVGGGQDGAAAGQSSAACMLEIASGTGCHVEAFVKVLPAWTYQPTEVSAVTPHRALQQ